MRILFVLALFYAGWVDAHPEDLQSLALNVYHEARGESRSGRVAVAEVTIQRAAERGTSIHHEVWRKGQFSWTEHKQAKARGHAWRQAIHVAKLAMFNEMAGRKPDVVATFYHSTSVRPYWAKEFERVAVIGNHVFYRPK